MNPNKNLRGAMMLVILVLVTTFLSAGCAGATEPELHSEIFFGYELQSGQTFICERPSTSFRLEAGAWLDWSYDAVNGALVLTTAQGIADILPLEEFPHQLMTQEMIDRARTAFTDVPFIDEQLSGTPNPTDEQWAEAYHSWLGEIQSFARSKKLQYKNDVRTSRTALALSIVADFQANSLVADNGVRMIEPEADDTGRTLWVKYEGFTPHGDGFIVELEVALSMNYQDPLPLAERVSREEALGFFQGLYQVFESGMPVTVDVSTGLIVTTVGR